MLSPTVHTAVQIPTVKIITAYMDHNSHMRMHINSEPVQSEICICELNVHFTEFHYI